MKIKNAFLSYCALVVASGVCFGQVQTNNSISVVAYGYSNPDTPVCTFQAKSLMNLITQTINIGSQSTGAGAGKPKFGPLTILKNIDSCSVLLLAQTLSGTPLSRVLITVNPSVDGAKPLLLIRLTLVAISSLTDSDSEGTEVIEKVAFEAGSYQIQDQTTGQCRGWDFVRNVSFDTDCGSLQVVK